MISATRSLALACLLAGACAPAGDPPTQSPPGPVAFPDGVLFECGADGRIAVRFQGTDGTAQIRLSGEETLPVEIGRDGASLSYAGPEGVLELRSAEAVWTPKGRAAITCSHLSEPIPPPAPGAPRKVLTESDAGAEARLSAGDAFAVALIGVPTAGYVWTPDEIPACLEKTGEASGPTSTSQRLPGFTGGQHWEVATFRAASACMTELAFTQRRPWEETPEPGAARIAFRLVVE